jgi:hypothetical protein
LKKTGPLNEALRGIVDLDRTLQDIITQCEVVPFEDYKQIKDTRRVLVKTIQTAKP